MWSTVDIYIHLSLIYKWCMRNLFSVDIIIMKVFDTCTIWFKDLWFLNKLSWTTWHLSLTTSELSLPQLALSCPSNNSCKIQSPLYVNFRSNIYKLKVSPSLLLSLFFNGVMVDSKKKNVQSSLVMLLSWLLELMNCWDPSIWKCYSFWTQFKPCLSGVSL